MSVAHEHLDACYKNLVVKTYRQQALTELKPNAVAGHGQRVVDAHQLLTAEDVFPANAVGCISVAHVNVKRSRPSSSRMLPVSARYNHAANSKTLLVSGQSYITTLSQIQNLYCIIWLNSDQLQKQCTTFLASSCVDNKKPV